MKQYEEAGIEGLARADAEIGNILPEGIDKTKEVMRKLESAGIKEQSPFQRTILKADRLFCILRAFT